MTAKLKLVSAGRPGETLAAAVPVPGGTAFEVAPGSVWEVSAEAPGYWSRPRAAVAGGSPVQLELLPTGSR